MNIPKMMPFRDSNIEALEKALNSHLTDDIYSSIHSKYCAAVIVRGRFHIKHQEMLISTDNDVNTRNDGGIENRLILWIAYQFLCGYSGAGTKS